MTYEQIETLREHKMHSLLTLQQAKNLAKELDFEFERRDLHESDTYYGLFEEGIFLKQSDKVVVFLGGKDIDYFGFQKRLFEIVEKNI